MFRRLLYVILALMALAGVSFAATLGTSTVVMPRIPALYVTSSGPAGSTILVAADTTGAGGTKKSMVHRWTIGGVERDVLIRIQETDHGIYVDLVADTTISTLSASVTSMSLTTASHPSPARDATDTAALVAAGGS